MVFGLSQEQEDREVKGRRGGGQFIKGMAVNKAIVIAIGSPRRQSGRYRAAGSRNDRRLDCGNRKACGRWRSHQITWADNFILNQLRRHPPDTCLKVMNLYTLVLEMISQLGCFFSITGSLKDEPGEVS